MAYRALRCTRIPTYSSNFYSRFLVGEPPRNVDGDDIDSIVLDETTAVDQESSLTFSSSQQSQGRPVPVPRTDEGNAGACANEDHVAAVDGQCLDDSTNDSVALDGEVLDILGEDPTSTTTYGKDIRSEVATRFEHIATNGLNKETRSDLCNKHLIPANATLIGAPALNPEIKAALTEPVVKRDKLIESRQKRLACAITCLGEAVTRLLDTKERDNTLLKLIMDAGRLVCDAQNNESVSRRNLAVYSLKKEMQGPLLSTKIDKSLFGEQLSESLKTAKAVHKSGTELKVQANNKSTPPAKNWKGQAANRRPPMTPRNRGHAAPMAPAQTGAPPPPPPPPTQRSTRGYSSRPPPPPQYRQARRRY